MKSLLMLAATVALATPTAVAAQPAVTLAVDCGAPATGEPPDIHGPWDFVFDASGTPNFGLMSIGPIDGGYGGSLSLWSTAPVVLREVTLRGWDVHLVVATPGGDVLFDGRLSRGGDRMCGLVTYHDGRSFPMVARKRTSAYQAQNGR